MTFRLMTTAALVCAAGPAFAQQTPANVQTAPEIFEMREIVSGLDNPWEIALAPDGWLWVTERSGLKINRINPEDGTLETVAELTNAAVPGGQDGLMGLALHPDFGNGTDQIFTAYTYDDPDYSNPLVTDPESPYLHLRTKIVRFDWNAESGQLENETDVITGLPASNDHNSGRIKIGPDGMLYYTIGDGGNNQLANWCRPILAQRLPTADEVGAEDWIAYQGKSLRMALDGTIPEDNPEIDGVRSHVYTYGHRNMQGIDFGPDGTLYASEHGPKTDDEVNILEAGGNYGWPNIAGYIDDKAYVEARWSEAPDCADLTFSDLEIAPSVPTTPESEWPVPENYHAPAATMFTVPSDWNFAETECAGIDYVCWPTVAPSNIEYYASDAIPGWQDSVLIATLKRGSVYRAAVSKDGRMVQQPFERLFDGENRIRDTEVSDDGLTIYVAVDSGGVIEGNEGGVVTEMTNPGAILAYTYTGENADVPADGGASDGAADGSDQAAAAPVELGELEGPAVSYTAEQAEAGKQVAMTYCAACHGADFASANYGPPVNGQVFQRNWHNKEAVELLTKSMTMPPSQAGTLSPEQYADVTAYILSMNGMQPGDEPLTMDSAGYVDARASE
ncbi:glucose/sorbosone family PQQ-dependent dehydrogenase [Paracoccus tegillarcae]|uniref:L-sorbosone dehydrogenase n=1 Tax=Paracoccus tegillarcae TaxID=1529068 RepID=A0A2K9EF37_9RHOB|nr:glucose/sorbosone family PQQ-dependent dehydrogenase [Paracoccus tegillarcae]AUH33563.1 L-sorbosone dehydrogenase [Paracoccus tegillarcae]